MIARVVIVALGAWGCLAGVARADIVESPFRPPMPDCGPDRRAVWYEEAWICLSSTCTTDADCPGQERCEQVCDFNNCWHRCRIEYRPRRAPFRYGSCSAASPGRPGLALVPLLALVARGALRQRRTKRE